MAQVDCSVETTLCRGITLNYIHINLNILYMSLKNLSYILLSQWFIYVDTLERCDGKFTCSNGTSISKDLRCDKVADCVDGSDEIRCGMV